MGIFGNAFTGWHLLIIIAVVVLIFGAPKLPGLARSLGQSMRIFKSEMKTMKDEGAAAKNENTSDSSQQVSSTSVNADSANKAPSDQKSSS
jgi:sec-independent protein translocase protein TatA